MVSKYSSFLSNQQACFQTTRAPHPEGRSRQGHDTPEVDAKVETRFPGSFHGRLHVADVPGDVAAAADADGHGFRAGGLPGGQPGHHIG